METLNEKLEDEYFVSNILLKYGKDNPDVVEYLSKNKLVTKDKKSNLCVVISYKKFDD